MGQSGSVMFMFERKGLIVIEGEGLDEDKVMEDVLEAGADDFTFDGDVYEISTDPNSVGTVSEALSQKGYTFISAEPAYVPATTSTIDDPELAAKWKSFWICSMKTRMFKTYGTTGKHRKKLKYTTKIPLQLKQWYFLKNSHMIVIYIIYNVRTE